MKIQVNNKEVEIFLDSTLVQLTEQLQLPTPSRLNQNRSTVLSDE